MENCTHLKEVIITASDKKGCEECLKTGDKWVHLRLCAICGKVGCCDNSKNKHATEHFKETGHPIIKSFQPGEDWGYCYQDDLFFEDISETLQIN